MDSRAFLDAARAALSDGKLMDSQGRISNDALFAAIEARLGVGSLPRRTWAKYLSSLGLKPVKWNSGKVRGWWLSDVPKFDVPKSDVPKFDVPKSDVPKFDVPKSEWQSHLRCRVHLPNPEAAGYTTKEALLEAVEKYPHLRPCPKDNWWWREWKYCEECDWREIGQ